MLSEDETAIRQVERLGYTADDVRHIILTHLDIDHSGGLSDFPAAQVHVLQAEIDAAFAEAPSFTASSKRTRTPTRCSTTSRPPRRSTRTCVSAPRPGYANSSATTATR